MKATLGRFIIAQSDDVITCAGYRYFPRASVRTEWLERSPLTESDRACPHAVQFYDVVIDDTRYSRMAWSYEAPQKPLKDTAERIGFWKDVEIGE